MSESGSESVRESVSETLSESVMHFVSQRISESWGQGAWGSVSLSVSHWVKDSASP